MGKIERNKVFIDSVVKMSYNPDDSPENFKDAYLKILEIKAEITDKNKAKEFVSYLEEVQKELASHGFQEKWGNREFYNKICEQIIEIEHIYKNK